MGLFKRNPAVIPVPDGYEVGKSKTGKTQELFLTPEQVVMICKNIGAFDKAQTHFYAPGCYNPKRDVIVMPARKYWPSEREWNELRRHEWAHADGWDNDHPQTPKTPGAR